ncbi:MAG TPA: GNAT family N-acetyltransferase [Candidatus Limnocylindria bacterium]|nr:GNAT family N-acetyltransferase [Candidatus Limnocylindria bacterium]
MTAAPLMPEIHIEDQPPADRARAYFERDRIMAAYALADIDASEIERARWWTATRGDEVVAAALIVEALPFRPCFASGEKDALAAIFRDGIREPRIVVATPPAGRLAVESVYRLERVEKMHRMAVDVATFRPRVAHTVTRLGADHIDDVIDLYGHASRTYFTPERLAREIYFGVYVGVTLAAAAGTHVRSRRSSIAAVGNVLTRLAYRDRGMATSVTSAVTAAALEEHRDVVLNVRQDNAPAIAVYDRLGYHVHGPFIEGPAVRRSAWDRILGRVK